MNIIQGKVEKSANIKIKRENKDPNNSGAKSQRSLGPSRELGLSSVRPRVVGTVQAGNCGEAIDMQV